MASWFGSFFRSEETKKTPLRQTPVEDPIVVLERSLERQAELEQKADDAEHYAKECIQKAATLLRQNKKAAADVQKKRAAMYRKQAVVYRQQANNLVQQSMVLQEASLNAEVHATMQQSLATGQSLVQHIDVDEVAETADDWKDLYEDAQEIGRALSEPLSLGGDAEEEIEGIDDEIAELMETQTLEEDLLKSDNQLVLPSVPVSSGSVNHNNPSNPGGGTKVKRNIVKG